MHHADLNHGHNGGTLWCVHRLKLFSTFIDNRLFTPMQIDGTPTAGTKVISKVCPSFDTPGIECLRPRMGVFSSGFLFFLLENFLGKHDQLDRRYAMALALQPGQGWAKPTPQGHGLDADAGHRPSKQAWRIKTLRRKALGDNGLQPQIQHHGSRPTPE